MGDWSQRPQCSRRSNSAALPGMRGTASTLCLGCSTQLLNERRNSAPTMRLQEGHLERLARALEGPTLVRKGPQDGICNGERTIYCAAPGSKRRPGGQVGVPRDTPFTPVDVLGAPVMISFSPKSTVCTFHLPYFP